MSEINRLLAADISTMRILLTLLPQRLPPRSAYAAPSSKGGSGNQ